MDGATAIKVSLDGGNRVALDPTTPPRLTENMFLANPGTHTLRVYLSDPENPAFTCTFELPTGEVADFEYGQAGNPPQPLLRCPPTFRPAPPAD